MQGVAYMKIKAIILTVFISLTFSTLSSYAQWLNDGIHWHYEYAPGSRYRSCWQWIDGNNDGIAECYYFDGVGNLLINTTTPDGYSVNESGAWIENGAIQTQRVITQRQNVIVAPAQTRTEYVYVYPRRRSSVRSFYDEYCYLDWYMNYGR